MDMEVKPKWNDSAKSIIEMGKFLERMKGNFNGADLAKKVYADHGINESSIGKLIKISQHPIIADPAYADKLPPSWAILYELRFLPDDLLAEKIKDGSLQRATKYDVWALRGVKRANNGAKNEGHRVRVPNDVTLIDYVRSGMTQEKDFNDDLTKVAAHIGIGARTYTMARAIIILSERPELSQEDKAMVLALLEKINKTRNVRKYYDEAKPLIDKIWGDSRNKKLTDQNSQKRVDAYLNSVFLIGMSSQRLMDQEIPYMSVADTDRAIGELSETGKIIRKVTENLRRAKHG